MGWYTEYKYSTLSSASSAISCDGNWHNLTRISCIVVPDNSRYCGYLGMFLAINMSRYMLSSASKVCDAMTSSMILTMYCLLIVLDFCPVEEPLPMMEPLVY